MALEPRAAALGGWNFTPAACFRHAIFVGFSLPNTVPEIGVHRSVIKLLRLYLKNNSRFAMKHLPRLASGRQGLGRPVDELVLKDGLLLVSDDRAGAIYSITSDRYPQEPAGEK
jgi:glucose/arabinose dehydrogenase